MKFGLISFTLVSSILLIGLAVAAQEDAAKKVRQEVQGTWTMASIVERGVPGDAAASGIVAIFKGDEIALQGNGQPIGKFQFTIDVGKKPFHMDFKQLDGDNQGKVSPAIFKVEKGTMTVCVDTEGNNRPREFVSKEGSTAVLVVLKRKQ